MTVCFMGGMLLSAKAENISIDMLNKKGKERMAYSEDVARVAVGDTITWKPTEEATTYNLLLDQMDGNFLKSLKSIKWLRSLLIHQVCIFISAHLMQQWV